MQRRYMKSLVSAAAAFALCFSPTMAHAATAASAPSLNPLVAVSVFGTPASAQAVCGNASGAATAAAATAVAQGQAGCVLPAVDVAPPPVSQVPPVQPVSRGFGISPILLGLLGIAALAALIALDDDDDDEDSDETPISPA